MTRVKAAAVLAVCILMTAVPVSPALAAKEKPVFGKFRATAAGSARGIGEADEMTIGPYKFEECEKELHSTGSVTLGETETFFQEVKFSKCLAMRNGGGGLKEAVYASFTLGMEFNSNGSLKLGPSSVTFGATDSTCEITIPAQWVPAAAETKGAEKSFEDAIYSTEREKLEGGQEKKFGEFRERLDVDWELKGVRTTVKLSPACQYEGSHLNAAKEAEFTSGKMEGELEEITVAGGNLSFLPAP